jgi:hypothetical protein
MPDSCSECRFKDYVFTTGVTWCGANCVVLARNFEAIGFDGRPEWCPLVDLGKHGDLIDADKLIIDLMDRGLEGVQTDDYSEIQQTILVQDTVIEAEDG